MKAPIDRLIEEARDGLGVRESRDVDWGSVDEGLFARIEQQRRAERARFLPGPRRAWAVTGAAALAACIVVAMVADSIREPSSAAPAAAVADEVLGTVSRVDGEHVGTVGGATAERGTPVRLNDVIDAFGGDVVVERAGKVKFLVERGSRVQVTHGLSGRGPLVLALEQGAVEADVVPVPQGEAFAVDVDHARVAVHGTHLRVARAGDRGQIDLSEGVVALGEAPRVGPVLGALVTATAHADFVASDPRGTLHVTHDPTAVRAPVDLGTIEPAVSLPVLGSPAGSDRAAAARGDGLTSRGSGAVAARASEGRSAGSSAAGPVSSSSSGTPEQTLASAVWACMAGRPRVENVTVLVSTTLHLDVGDDGMVKTARFEPPVLPEVNECASRWIYKLHFAHPGPLAIGIDFKN
jgi:FecR protein